jgi:signal transduction histidine kinase
MRSWLRGKRGGLIAFLMIAGLVAGGLGWVTDAALRLEQDQIEARAQADLYSKLRIALWRLDSYMIPELSREASRPFTHYNAVYVPAPAFDNRGNQIPPGTVLELSPLLNADLPEWMLLHFSNSKEAGWWSPQVLSGPLKKNLEKITELPAAELANRARLLKELSGTLGSDTLIACVREQENRLNNMRLPTNSVEIQAVEPGRNNEDVVSQTQNFNPASQTLSDQDFQRRAGRLAYADPAKMAKQQNQYAGNYAWGPWAGNGEKLFKPGPMSKGEIVVPGPMSGFWLQTKDDKERLIVARRVDVGKKQLVQGIVLNWDALQNNLRAEVEELFPEARLVPMRDETPAHPERTMTALPVELDPGLAALTVADPGWTPLRIGLALAWVAALIALLAVGLGGWSLIDLSQRRIRFVSTVTHELRTPLTTLRLYLDMLTGGMVRDDKQKDEYLNTLNAETDRLNRLVGNVLDFSRLENQNPRLEKTTVAVRDILDNLRSTWQNRCKETEKELVVDNTFPEGATLRTDVQLVQQILGNLIDNACKYSQGAEDNRLWLRVRPEGSRRVLFEVEDCGPGVPSRERRSIFRPFRRGREADVTAGGVGLGLALARRWADLLGGTLSVQPGGGGKGACFRLELPLAA